jgi:hypothetical protein
MAEQEKHYLLVIEARHTKDNLYSDDKRACKTKIHKFIVKRHSDDKRACKTKIHKFIVKRHIVCVLMTDSKLRYSSYLIRTDTN